MFFDRSYSGRVLLILARWLLFVNAARTPITGSPNPQQAALAGAPGSPTISSNTDSRGNTVSRLGQQANGLNVHGGAASVTGAGSRGRAKRQAGAIRVYGYVVTGAEPDLAGIDVAGVVAGTENAVAQAKQAWSGMDFDPLTAEYDANAMVYVDGPDSKAIYAYNVTLKVQNRFDISPRAIIATNGTVLRKWNEVKTAQVGTGIGGNRKHNVGWWEYGQTPGFKKLDVAVDGGTCIMENNFTKTVDCRTQQYECLNEGPFEYSCFYHSMASNGAYAPLNDVHYFTTEMFYFFDNYLGVKPTYAQLTGMVHYGQSYPQAFYAVADDGRRLTVYGDGTSADFNFGSFGRVAHEVSHAFLEGTSKLLNYDQSGGLGESLADMTEVAFSHYIGRDVNYKIGSEVLRLGYLRCMDDPPCDGKSIDNINDYVAGMDVHYSSGIFNKVPCSKRALRIRNAREGEVRDTKG